MRSDIPRRLKRLEASIRPDDETTKNMFIRFVRPNGEFGGDQSPADIAQCDDQMWRRHRSETEEDFIERVTAELPKPKDHYNLVMLTSGDAE
jgi:hypothetical protein